MKVVLAGPDYEENLSVRYLSASLQEAGHETILAAFNSISDVETVSEVAQDADIVGLSMCFQSRAKEFLHLARLIKAHDPEKIVVAGGHYASCAAEPLLANHPEIDFIVIHEGEQAIVEIAAAAPYLKNRITQIAGLAYRDGKQVRFTAARPMRDNLDRLPFPDRSGRIHYIARVPTSFMMGSRGCYGSCAYCCITTLHRLSAGKRFRQRSIDNIADEMAALYHDRGTRQFVFHDDNFLLPSEDKNQARTSAFEKALRQRGIENIALVIKCRPADAREKALRHLKELGLVRVFLGIESSTAQGLASLERVQTVEDSERALDVCAKLDISAQFTMMIFNPDATLSTLRSDIAFMRRYRRNPLNFCRAEIYTGTPLEQRMIALGRARGDYFARVYSLSDPAADRACNLSLDLFGERCWSGNSLMQNTIGLDHMIAVVKRFENSRRAKAVCQHAATWVRCVNRDTINLLEEVVDLSASRSDSRDSGFERALESLRYRELATRQQFLRDGVNLKSELEELRFASGQRSPTRFPGSQFRLARQAVATLLAIGIPAAGCGRPHEENTKPQPKPQAEPYYGISEMAAAPLENKIPLQNIKPVDQLASLVGTITDATGAVVANAMITVTNTDTGVTHTTKTNPTGQYVVSGLSSGRYSVKAQSPGFKSVEQTGVVLKAGESSTVDIKLSVGNWGCCEYAAAPPQPENWLTKKKPFVYYVGNADDHTTLKGIAEVVYGDPNLWLQIFEANRYLLKKPEDVTSGMALDIPPRKRNVPKLTSKILPEYPQAARDAHVWGAVLLDVSLKDDGSVDQVSVIEGPPMLVDAATAAVKQWHYRLTPRKENGPDLKFVVVVSFTKRGKVR